MFVGLKKKEEKEKNIMNLVNSEAMHKLVNFFFYLTVVFISICTFHLY